MISNTPPSTGASFSSWGWIKRNSQGGFTGASIVWLNLVWAVSSLALVYVLTPFYGIGQGVAPPALIISASDLFKCKHSGSILGVIVLGGYFGQGAD
jgi:hypothetical protein